MAVTWSASRPISRTRVQSRRIQKISRTPISAKAGTKTQITVREEFQSISYTGTQQRTAVSMMAHSARFRTRDRRRSRFCTGSFKSLAKNAFFSPLNRLRRCSLSVFFRVMCRSHSAHTSASSGGALAGSSAASRRASGHGRTHPAVIPEFKGRVAAESCGEHHGEDCQGSPPATRSPRARGE